ncbi:MAG: hypothetical protein AB7K52_03505 [Phycisphaerales bacterium]
MNTSSISVCAAMAAASVSACLTTTAHGALILETSSALITHTVIGGGGPSYSQEVGPIPAFSSNTFLYNTANSVTPPLIAGTAISNARIGFGIVESPGFVGIGFTSGSNLLQRGNSNITAATAATLRVEFSASWINESPTPFGSALQAGASFGLVGSVPNSTTGSAFVELVVEAGFRVQPPVSEPQLIRGPIAPTPFFLRSTSGIFSLSRSDLQAALPSNIPAGWRLIIEGVVQFRVHNEDGEASLESFGNGGAIGGDDAAQFFIPSPGAGALLALAGVFSARRRR